MKYPYEVNIEEVEKITRQVLRGLKTHREIRVIKFEKGGDAVGYEKNHVEAENLLLQFTADKARENDQHKVQVAFVPGGKN